ncbi:MAG: hypothetical protein ABIS18_10265, partial [Actinomycetota bacterium]
MLLTNKRFAQSRAGRITILTIVAGIVAGWAATQSVWAVRTQAATSPAATFIDYAQCANGAPPA